jgi:hypothetical protein
MSVQTYWLIVATGLSAYFGLFCVVGPDVVFRALRFERTYRGVGLVLWSWILVTIGLYIGAFTI